VTYEGNKTGSTLNFVPILGSVLLPAKNIDSAMPTQDESGQRTLISGQILFLG